MEERDYIELFRPVGEAEYQLIRQSGFKRFPPRLPEQPVFYPVLTQEYAEQIARDWNTKDEASGFVGYVLKFRVERQFLNQYEVHQVGSNQHREYWIPADDLASFNAHIVGKIEAVRVFKAERSES